MFVLIRLVLSGSIRCESGNSHVSWRVRSPAALPGCNQKKVAIRQGRGIGKLCSRSIHVGGRQQHNRTSTEFWRVSTEPANPVSSVVLVAENLQQLVEPEF